MTRDCFPHRVAKSVLVTSDCIVAHGAETMPCCGAQTAFKTLSVNDADTNTYGYARAPQDPPVPNGVSASTDTEYFHQSSPRKPTRLSDLTTFLAASKVLNV